MLSRLARRTAPLAARARGIATFDADYGLFINGSFRPAADGTRIPVENPATEETITHVAGAGPSDVNDAVEAGRKVFDSGEWSRADVRDRAHVLTEAARLLRERVPDFAAKEVLQTGRAIREMNAQVRLRGSCYPKRRH